MKKMFYFIPAMIVAIFCIFFAFEGQISSITTIGWASLGLFIVAGVLLSIKQWWGCLLGIIVGVIVICNGTQEHGQIISEIPIGVIVCVYYAIAGFINYKSKNK